ncbi:hypothetical protein Gotur_018115, partial [Gossypium turneri]
MAPTKEEEHKLKDYKDDSPVKLGLAEKFLKEVLDIPFAFKGWMQCSTWLTSSYY